MKRRRRKKDKKEEEEEDKAEEKEEGKKKTKKKIMYVFISYILQRTYRKTQPSFFLEKKKGRKNTKIKTRKRIKE